MSVGGQRGGVDPLTLPQVGKSALGVVGLTTGQLVDSLHVSLQKAGERDGPPAGRKTTSRPSDSVPVIRKLSVVPLASAIWEATVRCQISS